jgi:hypothetical protein|tara:strand:+ start:217 stop:597 length:381 start_codon:yes stop_codon:yes gene_type:complete
MAHFAEIDSDNKVLRVLVACNEDVNANGGDQSESAAEHFKTVAPLSILGVKWVQTSYNSNFRNTFASIGFTYDEANDVFIPLQPYPSWTLNNFKWEPPVPKPEEDINNPVIYVWDEDNQQWVVEEE